ncbi:MAG: acyl-CoA thioesterase [Myxococcota bacterium]
MFTYSLRLILPILRGQIPAKTPGITRTSHIVRLTHIDFNRHMNQAVYFQICESERLTWMFQVGAIDRWRSERVLPVVAEQRIIYRRELKPLQRYVVDTRAVGMDGRLLHLEQHLVVGQQVHATNHCKLIYIGPAGVLSSGQSAELSAPMLVDPLSIENWTVVA